MNDYALINSIEPDKIKNPGIHRFWLQIISDPLGMPMKIPVLVAKGAKAGKTLGITAAVHGDEINGIPIIHRMFKKIKPDELRGNIVALPVVNMPAFLNKERRFVDNVDLNHIMPGEKHGNVSKVYAYQFFERAVRSFDYLIDLHTASFGRINSYYIRADMEDSLTAEITKLMNAEIVVHNPPFDGTLRGAANAINIPAITLEVGNPNIFQKRMIITAFKGLKNVLSYLDFIDFPIEEGESKTVYCSESDWVYTDHGGILRVRPSVTEIVEKGDEIASIQNIFGEILHTYKSPQDGIVIGKSTSPVNQTGGRILHLGKIMDYE